MRSLISILWLAAAATLLTSCATDSSTGRTEPPGASVPATDEVLPASSLRERIEAIDESVAAWRKATTLEAARTAAETAANLIVGPNGPGYGDRNGDGTIAGDTSAGILPGLDGTPAGLASPLAENDCIARDVLGGPWTDPAVEWESMLVAIAEWRPDNNTMPSLPSHPMRIVGWATFTLETDSLDEAHEYAGHAKLHVDISLRALDC